MQCSQPLRPGEDAENHQPTDRAGFDPPEECRRPLASSRRWFRDEKPSPHARKRAVGRQSEVRGNPFPPESVRARLQLTARSTSRETSIYSRGRSSNRPGAPANVDSARASRLWLSARSDADTDAKASDNDDA